MTDIFIADEALLLPRTCTGRELVLKQGGVHMWRAGLEIDESLIAYYFQILSPDEVIRAERYYSMKDKRHFIAARGMLRHLLGRYLNLKQNEICFSYGAYGKPFIAGDQNPEGLCFNVSHSHGLSVIAIGHGIETGVDIEMIRSDIDIMEIAGTFFPHAEAMRLRSMTEAGRAAAFFQYWTRKEAYLKAIGRGLSVDLKEIDVFNGPAAFLDSSDLHGVICRWSLFESTQTAGYACALVTKGEPASLEYFDYPDLRVLQGSNNNSF